MTQFNERDFGNHSTVRDLDASQDHPDVIVWPPLIFGGALMAALGLGAILPLPFLQSYGVMGWQFWIGLVVMIFGLFLGLSGILAFRRAGTHVHPSHPALVVVTDGPFRLTRNPMYVGAVLCLIGFALSASADWLILFMPPVIGLIHYGVILREEAYLAAKFGTNYSDYAAATRRWL